MFRPKYHYWTIRPSQVDTTLVLADSIDLPNFPAYPSGHACSAGAFDAVLGHYLPQDRAEFTRMAWSDRGIVSVQLPEATDDATRARLRRRSPQADESTPPADVRRAIDGVTALMRGEPVDLSSIALDMEGVPPFHRRVFEIARTIPVGRTRSYGEIAAELGDPGCARAVGEALGRNPFPIIVPCHRVLTASGKLGGFSAHGGVATKRRMLIIERALLQLDL